MKYLKCLIIVLLLFNVSCEEIFIGPQPNFTESEQVPKALNVYGLLRPDSTSDVFVSKSFFYINKIIPVINDTINELTVTDAKIFVRNIENTDDTAFFTVNNQKNNDKYISKGFRPKELNTYNIIIYKEGYDTIYGLTTIPAKPEVFKINRYENNITLSILNNSSIFLYEIYYENELIKRKAPKQDDQITTFELNIPRLPANINIIGYDKNMTDYLSSVNVFIKPNTFRLPFSTVLNGFGCIGALNINSVKIN